MPFASMPQVHNIKMMLNVNFSSRVKQETGNQMICRQSGLFERTFKVATALQAGTTWVNMDKFVYWSYTTRRLQKRLVT